MLPTHVGMDRLRPQLGERRCDAPHARGDGPALSAALKYALLCSPRTWGWTAIDQER